LEGFGVMMVCLVAEIFLIVGYFGPENHFNFAYQYLNHLAYGKGWKRNTGIPPKRFIFDNKMIWKIGSRDFGPTQVLKVLRNKGYGPSGLGHFLWLNWLSEDLSFRYWNCSD
jgi:hypothetical protein